MEEIIIAGAEGREGHGGRWVYEMCVSSYFTDVPIKAKTKVT